MDSYSFNCKARPNKKNKTHQEFANLLTWYDFFSFSEILGFWHVLFVDRANFYCRPLTIPKEETERPGTRTVFDVRDLTKKH